MHDKKRGSPNSQGWELFAYNSNFSAPSNFPQMPLFNFSTPLNETPLCMYTHFHHPFVS